MMKNKNHHPKDLLQKKYVLQEVERYLENDDIRNAIDVIKKYFRMKEGMKKWMKYPRRVELS